MVCCVTGHRPKGFPFDRDESDLRYALYQDRLYCEIEMLIKSGYKNFITGMADGVDIDFAKQVIYFRDREEDVTLEAALPYPVRPSKIITDYSEERDHILRLCDEQRIVTPCYHNGCMQKRNRYMVDKSDVVLAVWNGKCSGGTWNTIQYACKKGKPIRYIMLEELMQSILK